MLPFASLLLATLSEGALAQLTPSPTYNPPPASSGLVASNATVNSQWATVLGDSLWFYDAQRSGNLSLGTYGNRVNWRNNSCLQDGSDWNLDLSGGWFDAGDYIKATFPLEYTMYALTWGALSYGRGYDMTNQTAYLDGTLRWGFNWLMAAHPSADQLFVQVASSDIDNGYWGGDQNIPLPRPAYPVNSSFPGTDVWASTASVFALGSILYSSNASAYSSSFTPPASPSLANASYSSALLGHAVALYETANTTDQASFGDSVPAIGDAYVSSSYGDDLAIAALSLALATNQSTYYYDAWNWYNNFTLSGSLNPWNWDSKHAAVYVMFATISQTRPTLAQGAGLNPNVTGWQKEAERWFDTMIAGNSSRGFITSGGLLYWNGDSTYVTLQPALSAAFLLLQYAPYASSQSKGQNYRTFANTQIDYFLGSNPMNVPYMVGLHPNSPQNPHSAPASGGTNINNIRNSPPTEAHVLYGAVVGGPLANDRFWDWRDDWVQCEVALDYNAVIPGLAAQAVMAGESDPPYVGIAAGTYSIPSGQPCDPALPCGGSLSGGAIAGIVIGALAFIGIICGVFWWRKHRTGRWL